MGWKNLKEHFKIHHIVQVGKNDEGIFKICIGSGYVHNLVEICPISGVVSKNSAFPEFLPKHYPALADAPQEEILALIVAPDQFKADRVVFTYEGAKIIEKLCEEYGWPNVTHDGSVMYENMFSKDRRTVVAWAQRSVNSKLEYTLEAMDRLKKDLEEREAHLKVYQEQLAQLELESQRLSD